MHQPTPTKTRYGGRFRLEIPVEFTLRGEGGFVKGVELIGVTLPPSPSLAAARDAFWSGHVAEVRSQRRNHELPPILEEGELRPGVPKVAYLGDRKMDEAHEVLLSDPGRGVVVKVAWRNDEPDARPAQTAERLQALNDVANAFSFLPPDYVAADPNAYYLKEGMVRIPYTASNEVHQEHFEIGFDGKTQRMNVGFEYEYREEPEDDRPGFLERAAALMAQWAFGGHSLRSRDRVVAGFSGQESVIQSKKEQRLVLGWMYEPKASAKGFQPKIVIDGESDDGDIPAVLALWDQVLDGVQRLVP